MSNIKIKNLQFSYENKEIIKNLNFTLPENKTLSIIGTSGSGKTTLLKLLSGKYSYEGSISYDSLLGTPANLEKKISVVFRNYENYCATVREELLYFLQEKEEDSSIYDVLLDELNDFFCFQSLYDKKISEISEEQNILIKILSYALLLPQYLAIDDLTCCLDVRVKMLLFNYLNFKNITLINVTTDMEEVLFTDKILCLYEGISAIDGDTFAVLQQEKVLKRLGLSLPFMVDASIQLQLYGLIDKICLNKEEMVKELWK